MWLRVNKKRIVVLPHCIFLVFCAASFFLIFIFRKYQPKVQFTNDGVNFISLN